MLASIETSHSQGHASTNAPFRPPVDHTAMIPACPSANLRTEIFSAGNTCFCRDGPYSATLRSSGARRAQVKLVDAWRGGSSSKDHFSPCGTSSCRVLRTKTRETEKGTGNEGGAGALRQHAPRSILVSMPQQRNKLSNRRRRIRHERIVVARRPPGVPAGPVLQKAR
ncbi:hypothetical protein DBV15_07716 [Temnothorax longispinosus]|uniref:Uncharacterized protein n=1 Tax=Temnothorax longispinosus TaxID=300112 RepID=A0A4S2KQJ4_9HYME|nr:hypothetical protein DBV15_07716 [Temnothorax longispinosus]